MELHNCDHSASILPEESASTVCNIMVISANPISCLRGLISYLPTT